MLTLSSEAAMAQQVSVRKEANNKKNPGYPPSPGTLLNEMILIPYLVI